MVQDKLRLNIEQLWSENQATEADACPMEATPTHSDQSQRCSSVPHAPQISEGTQLCTGGPSWQQFVAGTAAVAAPVEAGPPLHQTPTHLKCSPPRFLHCPKTQLQHACAPAPLFHITCLNWLLLLDSDGPVSNCAWSSMQAQGCRRAQIDSHGIPDFDSLNQDTAR